MKIIIESFDLHKIKLDMENDFKIIVKNINGCKNETQIDVCEEMIKRFSDKWKNKIVMSGFGYKKNEFRQIEKNIDNKVKELFDLIVVKRGEVSNDI